MATPPSPGAAEKEDLRPPGAPVCHMKRRSSQVWEAVRGLGFVFGSVVALEVVVGESGVGGREDWEDVRDLGL